MGFAVAEEAASRGAEVTVVAANVGLPRAAAVAYEDVETAAQLEAATRRLFPAADVLVMAAAVADFRPSEPADGKIGKAGREALELRLEPTTDVLAALSAARRPDIGFDAAENEVTIVTRAAERALAKAPKPVVARAILDSIEELRAGAARSPEKAP
jgi:phosphopantothenoylcysteine decarboxylase/phosphopantothenate--cysteine ligase